MINIRRAKTEDRLIILAIIKETNFFRPNELTVAAEVFDDAIAEGPTGDYQSFVAATGDKPVGWICYGQTPCTIGTFDIYWIVVAPKLQKKGIGSKLMEFAIDAIRNSGGRLAVIETSSTEHYLPTQKFYEKTGFEKCAQIKDFYAPGDDKIIYIRKI